MKIRNVPGNAIVAREVLVRNDISLQAKGLYAYLLIAADVEHATIKRLSLELKENFDTVLYAARMLESVGLIRDVKSS